MTSSRLTVGELRFSVGCLPFTTPQIRNPATGNGKLTKAGGMGLRYFAAMTAKRFDHFMAFWQQLTQVKGLKPAKSTRRVSAAKAQLKAAQAAR
jgi:hypothetical protein